MDPIMPYIPMGLDDLDLEGPEEVAPFLVEDLLK
jgi:hypothetical protein